MPDPSEPLLPLVARGDAAAVEACLQRYTPLVWSLARRLSRDVNAVDDVVQEILVDVWRSAARFDPALGTEATFVATIARRRIIDRQRRAGKLRTVELPEEDVLVAEPDAGPAAADTRDDARFAALALEQLKPEQRRVILLAVFEGLTHQEIAASTGMPLGTVKSHLRRGLERAARILRGPRPGEPG